MNWCGFPVGFRFATHELNDEFKKQCWSVVLKAASYADTRNMFLHEAEMAEPSQNVKIYIAVIGSSEVGPMQRNAEMWRKDAALLGHLAFYRPFVQENFLELYAPTHLIGSFLPDGHIKPEKGVAFLPDKIDSNVFTPKSRKAVVLSRIDEKENLEDSYAAMLEKISDHGAVFEIKRLNYTDGPYALYYATAYQNGLLCKYSYKNEVGANAEFSYGLLPGGRCITDARQFTNENALQQDYIEFLKNISQWHRKGVDVLSEDNLSCPSLSDCSYIHDINQFYHLDTTLKETEALFCRKQDAAFFKEKLSRTCIEI